MLGWLFIAGLCIILYGTFCSTLSMQFRTRLAKGEPATSCWNGAGCAWWLYMHGMSMGQMALGMVPASIAATTTFSGALVWNGVLAPFILKEQLTNKHIIGMLLLCGGACITNHFGDHTSQTFSWDEMIEFIEQVVGWVMIGIGGLITAALIAIAYATKNFKNPYGFAFLYSYIGALDLLVQKWIFQLGLAVALHASGKSKSAPPIWVYPCSFAVLGILHLLVLYTEKLVADFGDALTNRPLFLSTDAFLQVVLCGIFFREFSGFSMHRMLYFSGGFAIMLVGVIITISAHAVKPSAVKTRGLLLDDKQRESGRRTGSGMYGIRRHPSLLLVDSSD